MERPVGKWIKQERRARGWHVAELSRRLVDAGYRASEGTVRAWESPKGRDPGRETIDALERIFGVPAPVDRAAGGDVIAAIDRLTATVGLLMEVPVLRSELADLRQAVAGLVGEVERLKIGDRASAVREDQDVAKG